MLHLYLEVVQHDVGCGGVGLGPFQSVECFLKAHFVTLLLRVPNTSHEGLEARDDQLVLGHLLLGLLVEELLAKFGLMGRRTFARLPWSCWTRGPLESGA